MQLRVWHSEFCAKSFRSLIHAVWKMHFQEKCVIRIDSPFQFGREWKIILVKPDLTIQTTTLSYLLPLSFGPEELTKERTTNWCWKIVAWITMDKMNINTLAAVFQCLSRNITKIWEKNRSAYRRIRAPEEKCIAIKNLHNSIIIRHRWWLSMSFFVFRRNRTEWHYKISP